MDNHLAGSSCHHSNRFIYSTRLVIFFFVFENKELSVRFFFFLPSGMNQTRRLDSCVLPTRENAKKSDLRFIPSFFAMESCTAYWILGSYWVVFLFFCLMRQIWTFFHPKRQSSNHVDIIWLDNTHDQSTVDLLKRLNNDHLRLFTSVEECVRSIHSFAEAHQPICLITAGSFGVSMIPLIHSIDQLHSIFVFCLNKSRYDPMKQRYKKIHRIVNTYHELIIDLQIYLESVNESGVQIELFDLEQLKRLRQLDCSPTFSHLTCKIFDEMKQCSLRDLSKADTFFLWLKLLTSVLQKVHHTRESMSEMLEKCREYYKGNPQELAKIDEFERTYTKDKAIFWYTTPTFVSKLINKALRTEDFHALYICRAFIADLSEQLHQEYEEYKQLLIEFDQPLAQWTVFHGRAMSKEEIDVFIDKQGQLISLNGFLSTSRKELVADSYANDARLIIQTSFELSHGCFAHVAPISQFPQEDEVLFDLASVFKIESVTLNPTDGKWDVHLLTTDEGTNFVQAYIDAAKKEADEINVDFIFARLLIQMGEYSLAHDYLSKLEFTITEERDRALVYYYRGLNFYREGNYSQSMVEYDKALAFQRQLFSEGHSDLGETLGGIGLVYDSMGNYALALEKHLECLQVSEKSLPDDHVHTAEALNNIGLCYDRMGKFELALEYDVRALEMKQRLFPHDHPDIATSFNNIGLAYYNHLDFAQALDYHQRALAMKERCLPPDHSDLAVSYCNLGLAHLALEHFDQAIVCSMRDLTISEKTLSADHAELGITHHNLGQVYRAKDKNSGEALKHYQKAIEIYMKSLPRQHPYIGQSLMYSAEVLAEQGHLIEAVELGEEAMDILQATLPEEHRRRAESIFILAEIYKKSERWTEALEYAEKAKVLQLKTLNIEHEDVQKTQRLIECLKVA